MTTYDPRFSSKKRLAHLALRDRPEEPEAALTRWESYVAWCRERGQAIARQFRPQRAQSMLDQRKARGDAMMAAFDHDRGKHMNPYHFAILIDVWTLWERRKRDHSPKRKGKRR